VAPGRDFDGCDYIQYPATGKCRVRESHARNRSVMNYLQPDSQ
jgi:hypothetical protein